MTDRGQVWFLLGPCVAGIIVGCAALRNVTPADRVAGYDKAAKATALECKAYRFDRAAGLVPDVPAMTKLCE